MRILVAVLALAACGPHPESTPPPPEAGTCNAAAAQHLVGRQASPALGREAMRRAGAGMWRFLRPGQIVTMEFRADRLNISLDAQDKVERISCG
ncbi:MAG TPA: I78 family peptidase inhibitor [Allosphingosinicella sp.]|nr:I78 family peptidase inhibitor [Allosphingosinicella sp.]